MKKSIAIITVLLLSSASIFAAVPAKPLAEESSRNVISIQALRKDLRVIISIDKELKGKSFLTITDNNENVVFKGFLTRKVSIEKVYNLAELELGDYTIAVSSNGTEVERTIHIYDLNGKKTYFFFQ